jgi:hypothetical protein
MALWTPARTTTALWLDGADASTLYDATSGGSLVAADGAVARWEDKSGNARHVTQSDSGSRPARKTSIQNGRDVLRFDGSADGLETTFASFGTAYCVVAVAFSSAYSTNAMSILTSRSKTSGTPINPQTGVNGTAAGDPIQFLVRDDASNAAFAAVSNLTPSNSTWNLFGGDRNGNSVANVLNGTTIGTATATLGTITTTVTSVGYLYSGGLTTSSFWLGDIAEIVVGTLADRQRHEGYLAHKWGLAGNLPNDHPYKTNAPKYGVGGIAAAIAEII